MTKRTLVTLLLGGLMVFSATAWASVSSIQRELRRMVGYTVIASDSVSDVTERNGNKHLRLLSGSVFTIDEFILDPLVTTDVIIFAKPIPEDLRKRFPDLPAGHLYSYKLLIDGEFVDASLAR